MCGEGGDLPGVAHHLRRSGIAVIEHSGEDGGDMISGVGFVETARAPDCLAHGYVNGHGTIS